VVRGGRRESEDGEERVRIDRRTEAARVRVDRGLEIEAQPRHAELLPEVAVHHEVASARGAQRRRAPDVDEGAEADAGGIERELVGIRRIEQRSDEADPHALAVEALVHVVREEVRRISQRRLDDREVAGLVAQAAVELGNRGRRHGRGRIQVFRVRREVVGHRIGERQRAGGDERRDEQRAGHERQRPRATGDAQATELRESERETQQRERQCERHVAGKDARDLRQPGRERQHTQPLRHRARKPQRRDARVAPQGERCAERDAEPEERDQSERARSGEARERPDLRQHADRDAVELAHQRSEAHEERAPEEQGDEQRDREREPDRLERLAHALPARRVQCAKERDGRERRQHRRRGELVEPDRGGRKQHVGDRLPWPPLRQPALERDHREEHQRDRDRVGPRQPAVEHEQRRDREERGEQARRRGAEAPPRDPRRETQQRDTRDERGQAQGELVEANAVRKELQHQRVRDRVVRGVERAEEQRVGMLERGRDRDELVVEGDLLAQVEPAQRDARAQRRRCDEQPRRRVSAHVPG